MRAAGVVASALWPAPRAVFKGFVASNVATTSNTIIATSVTNPIAIGDLVVVCIAADNLSATTPTFTCTDAGSNAYTTHVQGAVNATAAAGVAGAIMVTKATAAVNAGSNVTVTLSGAVAARCTYIVAFTGVNNTLRGTALKATGTTAAQALGPTTGALMGDLVFMADARQTRVALIGDIDTTAGFWSGDGGKGTTFNNPNAASGTDATRVNIGGQWKIVTSATQQTWDVSGTAIDHVTMGIVLAAA